MGQVEKRPFLHSNLVHGLYLKVRNDNSQLWPTFWVEEVLSVPNLIQPIIFIIIFILVESKDWASLQATKFMDWV